MNELVTGGAGGKTEDRTAGRRTGPFATRTPLTVEEANAVAALADPTYRNLRITQGYHDLKIALTDTLGEKNVTWCAYATWASKTAGNFIRGEEVPSLIRDYLARADHVMPSLAGVNAQLSGVHAGAMLDHSFIVTTIETVMRDVTDQIALGNLKVFAELAPIYAKWVATFAGKPPRDETAIDAFVASTFTPGPIEKGGQDLLVDAFRAYHQAIYETDEARKAQMMFHANALVGYHEQMRLQDPIAGSLNAPLVDVFMKNAKALARVKVPEFLHGAVEALLDRGLRPVAERVEREWQQVSTRWLMTLALPNIVLSLGEDVPPLTEQAMFPEELVLASWEPLVTILEKLDRTPNTVKGSAADDWALVGDRMNYIVDFFRSRQQDPQMYEQPFSDAQLAAIRAGQVPAGSLGKL